MRQLYLLLAVLGFIGPMTLVAIFVAENGFDLPQLVDQMLGAPGARAVFADVTISSLVFWVFAYQQSRRHQIGRLWLFFLLNLLVGLSFALPLFLYVREARLAAAPE